ncbi:hypothetical protein [Rhodoferax saidenbachensis]|uniref:hypothetical protein n=1 Tax=Rhodoferax saidenbachensis TaxID=1484693 RepID=UPI0004BA7B47
MTGYLVATEVVMVAAIMVTIGMNTAHHIMVVMAMPMEISLQALEALPARHVER